MTNAAPAGWYPVPSGGQRFWDGRAWTPDVLQAPDARAEFAALAPDLPAPSVAPFGPPPLPGVALSPYSPPPASYSPPPLPGAVAPYSPPPASLVPQGTAPGWYPGPSGMVQWWDGRSWGPFAPQQARPPKDVGIAYIFLLLLGGFAAHRFYVGRIGSAVTFVCIWWAGWLLSAFLVGIPLVIAGVVWLIVDLFLLPSLVREANAARLNAY